MRIFCGTPRGQEVVGLPLAFRSAQEHVGRTTVTALLGVVIAPDLHPQRLLQLVAWRQRAQSS